MANGNLIINCIDSIYSSSDQIISAHSYDIMMKPPMKYI